MAFNNKKWLSQCLPEGKHVGTTIILQPIQLGYSIGLCLDRYSEKDMRRIQAFCCISLDTRDHIPLLQCEEIVSRVKVDDLDDIIPDVQRLFGEYRARYANLHSFAWANLRDMTDWKSMNGLLDAVHAHYLDPSSPLPDMEFTEESIRRRVNVVRPFEIENMGHVIQLAKEWLQPDFEQIREQRIQNWLARHRLKPDYFDSVIQE